MSATFTPGPWKLDSNPTFHRNRVWTQDMRPIVNLCSMGTAPSDLCPEAQANARLIAAAPEMLEVLHQYVSDLRYPPTGDSIQRRIERAQAVIAKAMGS